MKPFNNLSKKLLGGLFAAALTHLSCISGHAQLVNFGAMTAGTPVTTQFASEGLTFSLVDTTNNIGDGVDALFTPEIGIDYPNGISNSPTGNYPTADELNFKFTSPATVDSFTFDNYGDNGSSTWTALSSSDVVLGTGNVGDDQGSLTTINLSNVSTLQFSSNEGSGSWEYVVDNITYSEAAVPEPSTWAMMLGGSILLVVWQRRKIRV